MSIAILLYDQLLFRPLVVWGDKFRVEQTAAQIIPKSLVLNLFRRAAFMHYLGAPIGSGLDFLARRRLTAPPWFPHSRHPLLPRRAGDIIWFACIAAGAIYVFSVLAHFMTRTLTWHDVQTATGSGFLTLLRVVVLIILATLIWVPIGVYVGLRPSLAEKIQPMAQFLAAFPANLLFPVAVVLIIHFAANPVIWLSPLMIMGTQWYILFNVIAGTTAYPNDFKEAAATFRISGWRWWRDVMLPGIFPYYVTGAITAAGGAWNASIVSEVVNWGDTRLDGGGLGAYIAHMTVAGDFPRIALGIAIMSAMVVTMNRLIWRPLYAYAERRMRLD